MFLKCACPISTRIENAGRYHSDENYSVNNKVNFTPNLVAAELPLILVQFFTCFSSYVLFDCIDPVNNYTNNR